jgi:hypothetical protein
LLKVVSAGRRNVLPRHAASSSGPTTGRIDQVGELADCALQT